MGDSRSLVRRLRDFAFSLRRRQAYKPQYLIDLLEEAADQIEKNESGGSPGDQGSNHPAS